MSRRRNRPTRHQLGSGFTTRRPHGYVTPEQEGPPDPAVVAAEAERHRRFYDDPAFADIDTPAEEVIERRREAARNALER